MKKFLTDLSNELPIPMKLMEEQYKEDIKNENGVSYVEWSSLNNSNSLCYQSNKPISKIYLMKTK